MGVAAGLNTRVLLSPEIYLIRFVYYLEIMTFRNIFCSTIFKTSNLICDILLLNILPVSFLWVIVSRNIIMSKIKECILALRYPNVTFNPKGKVSKKDYINPKTFEKHLLCLLDWRFNPLTAYEFKSFLFEDFDIPYKSFILIFEGGYKTFIKNAFPILNRYKIPAMVFLVPNHIGDYNRWENGKEEILSIEDISDLNKTEMITFGSQTKSGKALAKATPEELHDEIVRGNCLLEEILRYKVEYFWYPFGKYNYKAMEKLDETDIQMAFVDRFDQITNLESFYKIPSVKMSERDNYLRFLTKIRLLKG